MAERTIEQVVEELASAVVLADADAPSLARLAQLLGHAEKALGSQSGSVLAPIIQRGLSALQRLGASDPSRALEEVSAVVNDLQRPPTAVRPSPPAPETAPGAEQVLQDVDRDGDTVELFADFLQESGDGIIMADEILVGLEQKGASADQINAIFRVFHTIKGVAGFLEITEIMQLAHVTESLLNDVRDGTRKLEGLNLDLVFDATAVMRKMMDAVKGAVEAGTEIPRFPELPTMKARFQEVLDQPLDEAAPAPAPAPAPVPVPVPVRAAPPPAPVPVIAAVPAPAPAPVRQAAPAPVPVMPPASLPVVEPLAAMPPSPVEALAAEPVVVAKAAEPDEPGNPTKNGPAGKLRETLKVDLERVDSMVEMIGELIIVESMFVHSPEIAGIGSLKLRNTLGQLTKISRDLQNAAMRMRTVPVHGTFQKMSRLVREFSRKTGKDATLVYSGEGTEMDRSMVERLEDPLVHMVRNAIDHGIEPAAERAKTGKPLQATIRLSAYYEGGSIVVELSDDGRGLQRDLILRKAIEKGLVREGESLSENETFNLIFAPGFSTAAAITEISGRGVGMDVVKKNIEGMRGRVAITSVPGQGSTFKMILPLTLAIIDGMLVSCGQERYIVPSLSIVESLQPKPGMLSSIAEKDEILTVRGAALPLVRLSRLFGVGEAKTDALQALVVVVESMGHKMGLLVDNVLTQQQVVIKPLGSGVGNAEFFSGAAILSDGTVGLILNTDRICSLVKRRHVSGRWEGRHGEARP